MEHTGYYRLQTTSFRYLSAIRHSWWAKFRNSLRRVFPKLKRLPERIPVYSTKEFSIMDRHKFVIFPNDGEFHDCWVFDYSQSPPFLYYAIISDENLGEIVYITDEAEVAYVRDIAAKALASEDKNSTEQG